jgi:hypothetical protein
MSFFEIEPMGGAMLQSRRAKGKYLGRKHTGGVPVGGVMMPMEPMGGRMRGGVSVGGVAVGGALSKEEQKALSVSRRKQLLDLRDYIQAKELEQGRKVTKPVALAMAKLEMAKAKYETQAEKRALARPAKEPKMPRERKVAMPRMSMEERQMARADAYLPLEERMSGVAPIHTKKSEMYRLKQMKASKEKEVQRVREQLQKKGLSRADLERIDDLLTTHGFGIYDLATGGAWYDDVWKGFKMPFQAVGELAHLLRG